MSGLSLIPNFPSNSSSTTSYRKLTSRNSKFPVNPIRFPAKSSTKLNVFVVRKKHNFSLRASAEENWEPESKDSPVAVAVAEKEPTEIDLLKKQLVDSFYGTNRGLSATSETRAEVVELITQLEAKNPTPAPTEALPLLNGKWILAYTSFLGLYPLLSRGSLPVVKVEEISQTIDSENFTVQNSVVFSGLGSTTAITTNAKFEVRSPKRVQIKFDEGIIGTPQLTDSIVLPENVEVLGQKFDLSPFKGLITSVQDTASNVAKTISNQPPLKFSISQTNAESWLLTTYLDEELRISRSDGGSVFVLLKEGSALLLP
ncbi:putative plastid-lipid-associated protein [Helianthus annuus]|nr:putative plastid-lipid-associated protein [Helianthus annuus]KAJ0636999.1 putative plastid-lipid-associated protein [Helianthus annuus]KAJ0668448.1 putative plastid-lipid-associated protein [Helianthus annuus]KAJ0814080.1 putative plastid-lipid-associated protein [Helianthus annuus]